MLSLYIQFLSRSLKSPQSIRNYVSGLKVLHKLLNLPFPAYSHIQVHLTFKGLDKILAHVPNRAAPISPQMLGKVYNILDFSDPTHLVFWTLFLFMFFLFARKSQFIPQSSSPAHTVNLVKRGHILYSQGILNVVFTWTKTHQTGGEPLVIPLVPIPGSVLCPVRAYLSMIKAVPATSKSPAFVIPLSKTLSPITYSVFHQVLRKCLAQIGLNPKQFSSHSFRRGGATFAYSLGIRGEMIQTQGDWASDAYKKYLEFDYDTRVNVATVMSEFIQQCK